MEAVDAAEAVPVIVPRPVGHPSALGVTVFSPGEDWMAPAIGEIKTAASVIACAFLLDDPELVNAFMGRLRDRSPFALRIAVDKSA